jgi:hypothetical protein
MSLGRGRRRPFARRGTIAVSAVLGLCACSRTEPPGAIAMPKTATTAHAARAGDEAKNPARSAVASAASTSVNGASPNEHTPNVAARILPAEERTWTFSSPALGSVPVVVLLPPRMPNDRFPVLIAMHGRGEALKGPNRGARCLPRTFCRS